MNWARQTPRGSPPDKGSFPLDHFGECKALMKTFMSCLKENEYNQRKCRVESREYLQCRMDNDLMVSEDLDDLGFNDNQTKSDQPDKKEEVVS